MNTRNIENGLALVGVLIVIVGVSFAAQSALAKESSLGTTTAAVIRSAPDQTLLQGAEKATNEAAREAATSLATEIGLELDIRLEDRTSIVVAGKK